MYDDSRQTMNVKIEYEGNAGTAHRKFSLEIIGLAHGSASGPTMAEKIVATLVAGDVQWVLDLGDAHRESGTSHRMLDH